MTQNKLDLPSSSALRLSVWPVQLRYMKSPQINECFPPALRAEKKIIPKNGVFPQPHTGFPAAMRTQQPLSLLFHQHHLRIRWGGDERDLPRFAAFCRLFFHVLDRHLIDLGKKIRKLLVRQQQGAACK